MDHLDVTWVEPDLAVGAAFHLTHLADLQASAIRRVVDLRAEACDDSSVLGAHAIELLHLPTSDQAPIAPLALDMGVAWVCSALDRCYKVLVHCQHGVGRSAMLAACVMVARGLDLPGALRRLKQSRCCVSPSSRQLGAIIEWTERRARARAERVALSLDELAAIVHEPAS
ncbi:MAG TPA: dual specificity protein phosphatase [Kofleriaceae bacterium]|nr:dual specificity protein phosphatase [Kofleriaceae bacterium]